VTEGLEHVSWKERLREPAVCSAWRREGSGDLTHVYKNLKGRCKDGTVRFFSVASSDRTRGNGHKLKSTKFSLNARKHFFTV